MVWVLALRVTGRTGDLRGGRSGLGGEVGFISIEVYGDGSLAGEVEALCSEG